MSRVFLVIGAAVAAAAFVGGAAAETCAWTGSGWARFADAANWADGKVPSAQDAVKPGTMLLDLGGGKASVAETKFDGWEGLYDFGVTNGTLTFTKRYATRSNRVHVERGGALVFAKDCAWAGGFGMGNDRWERVTVCDGGRMEVRGGFTSWHATIDVAPGGTFVLAPTIADMSDSFFPSVLTNRGVLEMPNGVKWHASGRVGGSFSIVQKSGTMRIGAPLWGFENDSQRHGGKLSVTVEGGRIEVKGHVAFMDFDSCTIAPGATVELYVAEGSSFDLSPFKVGKGAKIVKKGGGIVVVGGGAPPAGLSVEEGGTSFVPLVVKKAEVPAFSIPDRRKCPYEPKTPLLEKGQDGEVAGLKPGFRGRNAGLVRLTGANAIGDEAAKAWKAVAWRNEKVHGQFVVWAKDGVNRLRASVSPLVNEGGASMPAGSVATRFVRYVVGHASRKGEVTQPERLFGDCLDDAEQLDLPPLGYRPVWLTVSVPADAAPGTYRGVLTLRANASERLEFPLELAVRERTLPPPSQWPTFLDLWQHPWAVSRYHGVKPFSALHYALLGMYLRELASLGQKVITATVVDRPWGQGNNYEGFGSMVDVTRRKDGSWAYDYSVFDKYVAFAKECGIGPQIHCYTLAGFKCSYTDEATGERLLSLSGEAERMDYWRRFLRDFESHVKAKGWLGDVYLALDESAPSVLRSAADLLRSAAPGLKLAMAGERKPSEYAGVDIDNFSLYIGHVSPEFIAEAKARRTKGRTTSYYICCGPGRPNTFLSSPLCESAWQGIYTAATGIDGLLRWAAFTWPRDPLYDGSFIHWTPGDTYLLYPGPRASTRWEMLRDGLELAEKIRILRMEGKATPELERLLDPEGFGKSTQFYAERTAAVFAAVDAL